MEIELQEILEFISAIPPFDNLPANVIKQITNSITIRYFRRGSTMPDAVVAENKLYVLRTGAITILSTTNKLLGKLGEGDICTNYCLGDEKEKFILRVEEDTLAYTISCQAIDVLLKDYPEQQSFIRKTSPHLINQPIAKINQKNDLTSSLMQTPISEVLHQPVITAETGISIRDAAIIMAEKNLSSLVIVKNKQPIGILTDKDITKRCIAKDISVNSSIDEIMTSDMESISSDTDAFEAMMVMIRNQIKYLPIIDNNQLKGIVSVTDLLRLEGRNSVYITNAINKAKSVDMLQEQSKLVPQLQSQLVKMGVAADHIGKIITAISSAITRRLIELAEQQLGEAPVAYAWVAAGSHARREQSSHSDQDNALIISDKMKQGDDEWFAQLAKFVCDGLNKCDYVYCPGNVMATNSRWRQPVSKWDEYFYNWIKTPSPKALMYSSIFFDLRTISGDESLLNSIRSKMLKLTSASELFLSHLTFNALKLHPPLGFFRDFVLIHDGKHNNTLDLKHNGLAPIVDLARIYSLAEGIDSISTIERLKSVRGSRSLSEEGADNLLDAFEFISTLRIEHQVYQINNGLSADNYMPPVEISKLERAHLKDTFKVIQTLQSYLEMRYKIS